MLLRAFQYLCGIIILWVKLLKDAVGHEGGGRAVCFLLILNRRAAKQSLAELLMVNIRGEGFSQGIADSALSVCCAYGNELAYIVAQLSADFLRLQGKLAECQY